MSLRVLRETAGGWEEQARSWHNIITKVLPLAMVSEMTSWWFLWNHHYGDVLLWKHVEWALLILLSGTILSRDEPYLWGKDVSASVHVHIY
jgi:hypothetical protein